MTELAPNLIAPVVTYPDASSGMVLVCEHASNHIPPALGTLGLRPDQRDLHIAWDPGAIDVARHLAASLSAPLVEAQVSRLVYDCNRPPEAPDAMPALSEVHKIPGNQDLTQEDKAARIQTYYRPFEAALAEVVTGPTRALITIHSFTPSYRGVARDVEIGLLHGDDAGLAEAMMGHPLAPTGHVVRLNEPYGAGDGVTHTIDVHGAQRGIANVMIEIRNDLIATEATQAAMAKILTPWIRAACEEIAP